jgi:hypothetical protein
VNLLSWCRGWDEKLHGTAFEEREFFERFEAVTYSEVEAKVMRG